MSKTKQSCNEQSQDYQQLNPSTSKSNMQWRYSYNKSNSGTQNPNRKNSSFANSKPAKVKPSIRQEVRKRFQFDPKKQERQLTSKAQIKNTTNHSTKTSSNQQTTLHSQRNNNMKCNEKANPILQTNGDYSTVKNQTPLSGENTNNVMEESSWLAKLVNGLQGQQQMGSVKSKEYLGVCNQSIKILAQHNGMKKKIVHKSHIQQDINNLNIVISIKQNANNQSNQQEKCFNQQKLPHASSKQNIKHKTTYLEMKAHSKHQQNKNSQKCQAKSQLYSIQNKLEKQIKSKEEIKKGAIKKNLCTSKDKHKYNDLEYCALYSNQQNLSPKMVEFNQISTINTIKTQNKNSEVLGAEKKQMNSRHSVRGGIRKNLKKNTFENQIVSNNAKTAKLNNSISPDKLSNINKENDYIKNNLSNFPIEGQKELNIPLKRSYQYKPQLKQKSTIKKDALKFENPIIDQQPIQNVIQRWKKRRSSAFEKLDLPNNHQKTIARPSCELTMIHKFQENASQISNKENNSKKVPTPKFSAPNQRSFKQYKLQSHREEINVDKKIVINLQDSIKNQEKSRNSAQILNSRRLVSVSLSIPISKSPYIQNSNQTGKAQSKNSSPFADIELHDSGPALFEQFENYEIVPYKQPYIQESKDMQNSYFDQRLSFTMKNTRRSANNIKQQSVKQKNKPQSNYSAVSKSIEKINTKLANYINMFRIETAQKQQEISKKQFDENGITEIKLDFNELKKHMKIK